MTRKLTTAITALIIVLTIGCIFLYTQLNQLRNADQEFIESMLQGYWRIEDNTYLLIDDALFQIVDLGMMPIKEHFKCANSDIVYKSNKDDIHTFDVTLPHKKKFKIPNNLMIELLPIAGIIILSSDAGELLRATRDNEMSIAHFAT